MTVKFEIPIPINLTDEQITEIEEDINKRIHTLNQETKKIFELNSYSINIIVVLRGGGE